MVARGHDATGKISNRAVFDGRYRDTPGIVPTRFQSNIQLSDHCVYSGVTLS